MNEPFYAFMFDPPPDWRDAALPCAEANSLKIALEENPQLSKLVLIEVWDLNSCNLIWMSTDKPWVDGDFEHD